MTDHRIGLDLSNDVLDVLHRHGFAHGDDQHAGRAIFLICDLARIYEGSQDHPYGPSITQASYLPAPERPGPEPEPGPSIPEDDLDAVTLTHAEVRTVLTSLDLAAARNATAPRYAQTARTSPASPASAASGRPAPTTSWPSSSCTTSKPPGTYAARPSYTLRPASPASPPTRRPASDYHRQDTGRTRTPPPGRRSPCPWPAVW